MRLLLFLFLTLALVAAPLAALQKKGVSDDAITDNVRRKLANDPDVKGGALEVDVKNGVVTVKGKVKTEKARSKAEKLIHKVKGVTGVQNELVVSPT
ncbi:MAG: BON domain-containing protein [Bryobacterales bacterium]|nr:BON domain-containing protein [Bryobacterales bacterium]